MKCAGKCSFVRNFFIANNFKSLICIKVYVFINDEMNFSTSIMLYLTKSITELSIKVYFC